jgi:hypothetical protein
MVKNTLGNGTKTHSAFGSNFLCICHSPYI